MKIEKLLEAIKRKKIEYFDLDDYEEHNNWYCSPYANKAVSEVE